ncbi:MAG TPA: tRNA 2-thiouridine(34) synthase MnmA, partial [Dehalococcoidia bacterium]|nr:tRNA 2-thiouridine(34) synthase MnmA [Dehalococcoidia bacterium]
FVIRIIPETHQIVLGSVRDLDERQLWASRVTFVGEEPPSEPVTVDAKIRYNAGVSTATLTPRGDWAE